MCWMCEAGLSLHCRIALIHVDVVLWWVIKNRYEQNWQKGHYYSKLTEHWNTPALWQNQTDWFSFVRLEDRRQLDLCVSDLFRSLRAGLLLHWGSALHLFLWVQKVVGKWGVSLKPNLNQKSLCLWANFTVCIFSGPQWQLCIKFLTKTSTRLI